MTKTSQISLRIGRVHEVFGSGKYGFAAYHCACHQGPVVWIDERRSTGGLNPDGLAPFCDPGRFVFTFGRTHLDVLWMAEEALRAGVAPVVVVQVHKEIDLTAGRRLQLAAEAGKSLGLFLIPQDTGSNAAETRWHCSSLCRTEHEFIGSSDDILYGFPDNFSVEDSTLSNWSCIKNKSGTLACWAVGWDGTTHHIHMVKQVRLSKSA